MHYGIGCSKKSMIEEVRTGSEREWDVRAGRLISILWRRIVNSNYIGSQDRFEDRWEGKKDSFFWQDSWVEGERLSERVYRLYNFALDKEAKVAEIRSWQLSIRGGGREKILMHIQSKQRIRKLWQTKWEIIIMNFMRICGCGRGAL